MRVNHAGEFAAKYIYKSQLKYSSDLNLKQDLKEMYLQEKEHLEYFISELQKHSIRPTALLPLWEILSKILGASTGLLGKKYVMLTTEAVEDVIDQHYTEQLEILKRFYPEEKELYNKITKFREEELEHKEHATQSLQDNSITDKMFSSIVKMSCKKAIFLSKLI